MSIEARPRDRFRFAKKEVKISVFAKLDRSSSLIGGK